MSTLSAVDFETKFEGMTIVAPCMEIVLLLDTTSDEGILEFYHRARAILGERITHYQANNMKNFSKLTPRAETMFPTWFSTPFQREKDYFMVFCQGDVNQQATASTIHMNIFRRPTEYLTEKTREEWAATYKKYKRQVVRAASMLRLTLPLDHPMVEPEKLIAWILDLKLISENASFTAYCGLALNQFDQAVFGRLHYPAQQALKSLVLRHPGLGWVRYGMPEINRYEPQTNEFRMLVKRANWFNVICDHTLDAIGGRSKVLEQVTAHPNLSTYELKHAIAIRAGEAPAIGDIGRRDFLPVYRELAAIIRQIRLPVIGGPGPAFMYNEANEWLNAFDKEIE